MTHTIRAVSDESLIGAIAKKPKGDKPKRNPFQEVETDFDPWSIDGLDIPLELEECLDNLIKHATKKTIGSIAHIAFILSDMYPSLKEVSRRADRTTCEEMSKPDKAKSQKRKARKVHLQQ